MTRRGRSPRERVAARFALCSFVVLAASAACGEKRKDTPFGVGQGDDAGNPGDAGRGSAASGGTGGTGGTGDTGGASGSEASAGAGSDGVGGSTGGTEGGESGAGNESGSGAGGSAGSGRDGSAGSGRGGSAGSGPGVEQCTDGQDNDGDDLADCADDDCDDLCATACEAFELVSDPTVLELSNVGYDPAPSGDCPARGPALTYEIEAETTGVLEVEVQGSGLFIASITSSCDAAESLACGLGHASAAVTAGDRLYVRIAGRDPEDVGDLALSVYSRAVDVCSDGYRDASEHCDDGNAQTGDGCDDDCAVESSELEPNDTLASASLGIQPFYGEIDPAGDEDLVQVDLAEPATLVAETVHLGDSPCSSDVLDSYLELLDASGDLLASNDDGGDGDCARLNLALQAGRYFLRVKASPTGVTPSFPYQLVVTIQN
jgi:cysteine-rich repeat protein